MIDRGEILNKMVEDLLPLRPFCHEVLEALTSKQIAMEWDNHQKLIKSIEIPDNSSKQ